MPARFVAACCLLAILSSVTFAAAPVVEPTGMWSGKIKDESLRKLAPKSGFIADAGSWKKLWTAWRPDEEMPKVDFTKELILIGTVPGPNQVVMQTSLTDKGNVKLTVFGTEIAGPGFGYKIIKIGREGVKTVNGKAVNAAAEESITVTVVGTLRTGIFAIGGETTGTTITSKGITWELDFGKNAEFRKAAEKLNGKKVVVQGSLERRRGVEIKERWIVTVTGLSGYEKGGRKAKLGVGAVEKPAQVQAKVLDGSGRNEKVGDLEIWISQAVAKSGSPLAKPYTGWIALTGESQRLHTSNGFIINGKVTERNGKYEIEIDACAGVPFDKNITLKPGERRIVNLTDDPAPNNVFIALKAPVSERKALEGKVGREGSKVRFLTEGDKTVIDIASKFGIDNATIKRKSNEWPKSILVRLHLGGLESFKAGGKGVSVEWSVSSTGEHPKRVSLRKGREEVALDDRSPYHTTVRIVDGNGKIPLKDGYFEVPLPAKLFERNPEEITLRWIDFYRN